MKQTQRKSKKSTQTNVGGVKFDSGKPPLSLISSHALFEMAKVLDFGKRKYSAHNWRNGFVWSRVFDAAQRHLAYYNSGDRVDAETGLSHLAHAMVNLMFLIEFEKTGKGEDDLWKEPKKENK